MKITNRIKHLHISPQKCRLIIDLIRGLDVIKAQAQLKNLRKKAALPILKLLNSSIASAGHNYNMEKSNLYIDKIFVDSGTAMKRWRPRAFGRAYPILKRTSHITIVLNEKVAGLKSDKKKTKGKKEKSLITEKREKKVPDKKDIKKSFKKINKDDHKPAKKEGGVFKKIFRRKAV